MSGKNMGNRKKTITPNEAPSHALYPDESPSHLPLDALITIAEERKGYVEQMRSALISGDDVQLKLYARKLCGMPPESELALPPKLKGEKRLNNQPAQTRPKK
jgi:hypothetical protein